MGNILLIDDNADFRELFKISLENAGIKRTIYEANDPIEALNIFNTYKERIQIVICDFYMPVQNGNDLLEMIKSHDKSIFCCILTADESLVRKKFPAVDKCFFKENLVDCMSFLKNINWRR